MLHVASPRNATAKPSGVGLARGRMEWPSVAPCHGTGGGQGRPRTDHGASRVHAGSARTHRNPCDYFLLRTASQTSPSDLFRLVWTARFGAAPRPIQRGLLLPRCFARTGRIPRGVAPEV